MLSGKIHSLSVLSIHGADASAFLQGQLTTDVSTLCKEWQLTGYCSPKGRLLALLYLFKKGENEFCALVSKEISDSITKRLRMYVLRSHVEITENPYTHIYAFKDYNDLVKLKPKCQKLANTLLVDTTDRQLTILDNEAVLFQGQQALFLCEGSSLPTKVDENNYDDAWARHNIDAGIPTINKDTAELFVPQMINLDLLNGINFKKGCYTGQEIVARVHYLGKLKQRMFVCDITPLDQTINDFKIHIGDKIVRKSTSSPITVGNIVSTANGFTRCLAVLKLDTYSNNDLTLENGIKIKVSAQQPYKIIKD